MSEVSFRKVFRIRGALDQGLEHDVAFDVPVEGHEPARVSLGVSSVATASWRRLVSPMFVDVLEHRLEESDEFRTEARTISASIAGAVRRLVRTIKYAAHHTDLSETLSSAEPGFEWLDSNGVWRQAYSGDTSAILTGMRSTLPLRDPDTVSALQDLLNVGYEPLEALRHLHRAEREDDARSKWIEATIAAELAVKEVLLRLRPELSALLLEVPSPPIEKLYGKILEAYSGTPSKHRNRLAEGAAVRNRLLHRPGTTVELEKAVTYASMVRAAIYDLLIRIEPPDPFARFFHFGRPRPGQRSQGR